LDKRDDRACADLYVAHALLTVLKK